MRRLVKSGKVGAYGDFRNFERIRAWTRDVGAEIQGAKVTAAPAA